MFAPVKSVCVLSMLSFYYNYRQSQAETLILFSLLTRWQKVDIIGIVEIGANFRPPRLGGTLV